MLQYGEKKIEVAEDIAVAAKMLEQGETAVKVIINGISYIITSEENYNTLSDGSSVLK